MQGSVPSATRCYSVDLAAARQRRGLSLEDVAAITKIRVYYLQAIEDGTFNKLPHGVYRRSYIRQYAAAIDYPESDLLNGLPADWES